jgi:hypothetical protein
MMINPLTVSSYLKFPFLSLQDRLQTVLHDVKTYEYDGDFGQILHEKALIAALQSCLDDCLITRLNRDEVELVKQLAEEIKRRGVRHGILFNALAERHKEFLNSFDPLCEDSSTYDTDISNPSRLPHLTTTANADFGDGKIYRVAAPKLTRQSLQFNLVNHPHLKLHFFSDELALDAAKRRAATHLQLKIFNVASPLFLAQGHLFIESSAPVTPFSRISFSALPKPRLQEIANQIRNYLNAEKMWNINLLGNAKTAGACFALHEDRVVPNQLDHRIVILKEDTKRRHHAFIDSLKAYPQLLQSYQSLTAIPNAQERFVDDQVKLLTDFNCDPEQIARHLEPSLVLLALLNNAKERLSYQECFAHYRSLGTNSFDLLMEYASKMVEDHLSTINSFEVIGTLQERHNYHFLTTLLYYLCENFCFQNSLEEQIQYIMNFAEATLINIARCLESKISETPDSFYSVEEFLWARVGNNASDFLTHLMAGVVSGKTSFHNQLILIRYAAEKSVSSDLLNEKLGTCLQEKVQETQDNELLHLALNAQFQALRH